MVVSSAAAVAAKSAKSASKQKSAAEQMNDPAGGKPSKLTSMNDLLEAMPLEDEIVLCGNLKKCPFHSHMSNWRPVFCSVTVRGCSWLRDSVSFRINPYPSKPEARAWCLLTSRVNMPRPRRFSSRRARTISCGTCPCLCLLCIANVVTRTLLPTLTGNPPASIMFRSMRSSSLK